MTATAARKSAGRSKPALWQSAVQMATMNRSGRSQTNPAFRLKKLNRDPGNGDFIPKQPNLAAFPGQRRFPSQDVEPAVAAALPAMLGFAKAL
jgi:hypothetical protein